MRVIVRLARLGCAVLQLVESAFRRRRAGDQEGDQHGGIAGAFTFGPEGGAAPPVSGGIAVGYVLLSRTGREEVSRQADSGDTVSARGRMGASARCAD
jgi:hypothetical protein